MDQDASTLLSILIHDEEPASLRSTKMNHSKKKKKKKKKKIINLFFLKKKK
jgi:accessory gene regulator protein AgrB